MRESKFKKQLRKKEWTANRRTKYKKTSNIYWLVNSEKHNKKKKKRLNIDEMIENAIEKWNISDRKIKTRHIFDLS